MLLCEEIHNLDMVSSEGEKKTNLKYIFFFFLTKHSNPMYYVSNSML